MNNRVLLLSSAAAIALSSNAMAAQGDTYISLFGGYSMLEDTDILHYRLDTVTRNVTSFARREVINQNGVPVVFPTGTSTTTRSVLKSYTVVGTLQRTYIRTDLRQFSGSVGTDGWVVGASFGVELIGGLRGEAEAAFRRFDFESGAALDTSSFYLRRYRIDAYYNYKLPLDTGTYSNGLSKTQSSFLTSTLAADSTVTRYATNVPATVDGELTAFSFMANLWYDFPLGDSGFTPFIGGGIGVANLTLSHDFRAQNSIPQYRFNALGTATASTTGGSTYTISPTLTTTVNYVTPTTNFKDDDAVFAYQFGAGLGYEFENGVRLSAQYRYFATTDGDFGNISENVESSDIILSLTLPFGR